MVRRGGFSFVAMLVINPIVILFYQNCSMSPISHASRENPAREISSVKPETAPTEANKNFCDSNRSHCPESK